MSSNDKRMFVKNLANSNGEVTTNSEVTSRLRQSFFMNEFAGPQVLASKHVNITNVTNIQANFDRYEHGCVWWCCL